MNWLRKLFAPTPPPVAPQGMYRVKKASIPVNAIPSPLNPVVYESPASNRDEHGELRPTMSVRTGEENWVNAVTGGSTYSTGRYDPMAAASGANYITGTSRVWMGISGVMSKVVYQSIAVSGMIGSYVLNHTRRHD